ncbi:MAG: hypothetical protein ACOYYU_13945 [Chloroflexota bacterium]
MNTKIYLVGMGGGVICSLVLWFPLAEYLPSTFIHDWVPISSGAGWGLVFLAALVVLACGAMSARASGTRSRQGAAVNGAIAGWMAALVSYIMVGGAAAGMWGARPLLEFGLGPAQDDAQFIQLLMDSVTGIHWWTMLVLWGFMLMGLALGAFGGLLAGPGGEPEADIALVYQVAAVSGMLTGVLVLIIETAVLSLLTQSIVDAAAEMSLVPAYPTNAILAFPVVTTFLMMLASLWLWWYFYRYGQAAGQEMNMQARMSAMILFGVPTLALILVFMIYSQPMFYTLYLPFFVLTILASGSILRRVWKESTNTWNSTITLRIGMTSAGLSFLVMVAGAYFSTLPAALGDVMLVVSSITALTPGGGEAAKADVVELVREHYAVYRDAGLLLALVVLPVFSLVAGGLVILLMRWVGRRVGTQTS